MRFARWSFALASIYGLGATLAIYCHLPLTQANAAAWWFAGAAAATQLAYAMIAIDPPRYYRIIPIGILSKLSFALPTLWLATKGTAMSIPFAFIDLALAALFTVNYARLRRLA